MTDMHSLPGRSLLRLDLAEIPDMSDIAYPTVQRENIHYLRHCLERRFMHHVILNPSAPAYHTPPSAQKYSSSIKHWHGCHNMFGGRFMGLIHLSR